MISQEINILSAEVQILDVIDDLLQASGDGKTAAIGAATIKQIEISDAILVTLFKVTVCHGQFVEVHEHGHVQLVIYFQSKHLAKY